MLFGQVRLVFSGAVEVFFRQRWLSSLEKIGPYVYFYRAVWLWCKVIAKVLDVGLLRI